MKKSHKGDFPHVPGVWLPLGLLRSTGTICLLWVALLKPSWIVFLWLTVVTSRFLGWHELG